MSEGDPRKPEATPAQAALRTARTVLLVGLALVVLVLPIAGGRAAASTFVGGVVAALNVYAFTRTVGASLGRETSRAARAWALLGPLKLILFLALVGFLMVGGFVAPLPFLVGYAALPVGLTVAMLRGR